MNPLWRRRRASMGAGISANGFGMLGLGDRASRQLPQPVALPDAAEAVEVVCGFAFTLVRLELALAALAPRPAP